VKFFQFEKAEIEGLAVEINGAARGLMANEAGYPGSLDALVRGGPLALSNAGKVLATGHVVPRDAVKMLPPLRNPEKIICVGLNYRDHSAESGFKQPDYPTLFSRFNSTLTGDGAPIVRPRVSTQLDYEGELVAILGKTGRNISAADALQYVIGYSIFNEASIRDYQFKSPQWTMGKNFDHTGAFGPYLVTADELPRGGKNLRLQTRLNGKIVQDASTNDMVFDVTTLVSIISEAMTLKSGDIIVTGTPSGVGAARKPPLWMQPGDVVDVEIERIGCLSNPIIEETAGEERSAA
jgi:2-keto-4-pentenoate hydratase/2-oxohepta-3-ene-1,7-dioic acid hydratase in catechol pathway